jgi:hypothetical protein
MAEHSPLQVIPRVARMVTCPSLGEPSIHGSMRCTRIPTSGRSRDKTIAGLISQMYTF